MPSPSRAIQQLTELETQGSVSFKPDPTAIKGHMAGNGPPARTASWWNPLGKLKQALRVDRAQNALFELQLNNSTDVQRHQDDVQTQTVRYGIESQRIQVEQAMQERSKKALAESGVRSMVDYSDGVEVVGLYTDSKLARVNTTFRDPIIKERTLAAIRHLADYQLTELEVNAIGMKFGLNAGAHDQRP